MHPFHPLKIKEVKKETPSAVSLLFDIPSNLASLFHFTTGQYVTLKTSIDGTEVRRAYSICSSEKSGDLRVAVKTIPEGLFSNFAFSTLEAGYVLDVSPPEGTFLLKTAANQSKNYLAFAAGSGITPVFSMVKTVLESEPKSSFTLVYGNKSEKETLFKEALDTLTKKHLARLRLQYVFSQERVEEALLGRIDKSTTNYIVKINGDFCCGRMRLAGQNHAFFDLVIRKNAVGTHHSMSFGYFGHTTTANSSLARIRGIDVVSQSSGKNRIFLVHGKGGFFVIHEDRNFRNTRSCRDFFAVCQ